MASTEANFADRVRGLNGDRDGHGVITHAFPVRKNLVVAVTLPHDLAPHEAERMASWIETMAVPEAPCWIETAVNVRGH